MTVSNYFSGFGDFDHNAQASLISEFERLAVGKNWTKDSKKYNKNKKQCVVAEMGVWYDGHSRLEALQELCKDVRIKNIPDSITQCRKALKSVFVNIYDLLDAKRQGHRVQTFKSKKALQAYTVSHQKIFPKEWAKADGIVKELLIVMF